MSEKCEIVCTTCSSNFFIDEGLQSFPKVCPFCGSILPSSDESEVFSEGEMSQASLSFIPNISPNPSEILFEVGAYQILKKIGQGGMGEIFLAYDTQCGRRLALKRIRSDRKTNESLYGRFLKEARLTSQLTHPAIIPIYSISSLGEEIYYTMPYVEGKTLKDILLEARKLEKKCDKSDEIGASVPALTRVFLQVCHAMAYAHSQGVLHRDIKGSNVIIGKFGEVLLLDWGLAISKITAPPRTYVDKEKPPSRVAGTLPYLAPERILGASANPRSEIYSLGVLLYNLLTLRHPFVRTTLDDVQKNIDSEILQDPSDVAPHRNISPHLEQICKRCLASDPLHRYSSVNELVHELELFLEGRSEWFEEARLNINNKEDWQFQENVLIAEQTAITKGPESSDWVSMMISSRSFPGNVRLDIEILLKENGHGIGILLNVPEEEERKQLNDGYCLWLSSEKSRATKLLRSTVEVLHVPESFLQVGKAHRLRVEIVDSSLHLYLDGILQITYVSHLPLGGTHIGILARDADFELSDIAVFSGSESVQVSCLAVPDAFLAHGEYEKALTEYRRIAYSFPGRQEGHDALFKAGITLLEQSKRASDQLVKDTHASDALDEFDKLLETSAKPLAQLGKALVYELQKEVEEEIKCYHMAFRRFPKHPLLNVIKEQILCRIHECAKFDRHSTYEFAYIVSRFFPKSTKQGPTKKLFNNLEKHWEQLPFIQEDPYANHVAKAHQYQFSVLVSFWLGKPLFTFEVFKSLIKTNVLYSGVALNALYLLLEMGSFQEFDEAIEIIDERTVEKERFILHRGSEPLQLIRKLEHEDFKSVSLQFEEKFAGDPDFGAIRALNYLSSYGLERSEYEQCLRLVEKMNSKFLAEKELIWLNRIKLKVLLSCKEWSAAGELIESIPLERRINPAMPDHFLYGCYLAATEGEEIAKAHFSGQVSNSFPKSWNLVGLYLNGSLKEGHRWFKHAFKWEKLELYRGLTLYHRCIEDQEKVSEYQKLCTKLA